MIANLEWRWLGPVFHELPQAEQEQRIIAARKRRWIKVAEAPEPEQEDAPTLVEEEVERCTS